MTEQDATEVLFYHLENQPLERVLPTLLEKTLERGWRAVVQAGSQERLEAIDTLLWTYRDESFLPHGMAGDDLAARQPIALTLGVDNPNAAAVRFLVDGVPLGDTASYRRVVLLFDGRDEEAVVAARGSWKSAKAAGAAVSYWQQDAEGRWRNRA
ncbi:MAG: DNA polymerase III subunit chi [Hyphomicrobiaceae bacterium]|nr:DNA polymerase III subunit chi [Hyphomicrobiaceae bacterium]